MKNFILLQSRKIKDRYYGKGKLNLWKHIETNNLLWEYCYPIYHRWADNRGICAELEYWVREFKKHPIRLG